MSPARRPRVATTDPEGFMRLGGDCTCGRVYTYAGHVEPGQFGPDCPTHGEQPTNLEDLDKEADR